MKSLKEILNVKETSEIFKDNKKFGLIFGLIAVVAILLIWLEMSAGPVLGFLVLLLLFVLFSAWLSHQLYDFDNKKPKKIGLYQAIFSLIFLLATSLFNTFFAVISLVVVALSAILHFSADSKN